MQLKLNTTWLSRAHTALKSKHLVFTASSVIAVLALVVLILVRTTPNPISQRQSEVSIDKAREAAGDSQYQESERYYKKVVAATSDNIDAWRELGFVYQMQKKRSEAITAYETARDLGAKDAALENNLGNLYRDEQNFELAEQSYRAALELNPDFTLAIVNLSHLYVLKGNVEEAIATLKKEYDGTRRQETIGLQLAQLYLQHNKKSDARAVVDTVLRENPGNTTAQALKQEL